VRCRTTYAGDNRVGQQGLEGDAHACGRLAGGSWVLWGVAVRLEAAQLVGRDVGTSERGGRALQGRGPPAQRVPVQTSRYPSPRARQPRDNYSGVARSDTFTRTANICASAPPFAATIAVAHLHTRHGGDSPTTRAQHHRPAPSQQQRRFRDPAARLSHVGPAHTSRLRATTAARRARKGCMKTPPLARPTH
jgi:hypothetical protein